MEAQHSALFVCLGNTCRSTMSEGILRHLLKEKGILHKWKIDSAGLANWHAGKPPDEFTIEMLQRNNMLGDYTHKARQITYDDFMKFHFILAMDELNLQLLGRETPPGCVAKVQLLGSYDLPGEESEIYDPYMGTIDVFEEVYAKCLRCCKRFLESQLNKEENTPIQSGN